MLVGQARTVKEATQDGPYIRYQALAMRVLAVATTRYDGWCAYIDGVAGIRHRGEWERVLHHGDKLGENVARVLFPEFAGVPYAD